MGVIYSITTPTGKLYVGKTYNMKHRIASHKYASKKGGTVILHNSIKKYGWDNHLLTILETVEDHLLDVREMYWIATLKTYCYENPKGANMTRGGEGQRHSWMNDTERRKKASAYFTGSQNPFFGKKHTEETKRIVGEKASKRQKERGTGVPEWGVKKMLEVVSKPVIAYNLKGKFIAEFESCAKAAGHFKMSVSVVSSVARGEQRQGNDMVFVFRTENYPKTIDVGSKSFQRINKAVMLLDFNGVLIQEYKCAREAQLKLNIPIHNIHRAANEYKGRPLRSGHCFMYKDEYEEKQRNQLN